MSDSRTSFSTKRDDTKCANCALLFRKIGGRRKVVQNDNESLNYSNEFGKPVQIGDILCSRCRLIVYRKKMRDREDDLQAPSISTGVLLSQQSGTLPLLLKSLSNCTNTTNSQSSGNDPSFVPRFNEKENDVIEMPFQRVIASHKYCFLCSSSINIIIVPFEARLQAFKKKRIFIPQGNRCCSTHIIKKRFFEDELNNMKLYSSISTIEVSDLMNFVNQLSDNCNYELKNAVSDGSLSDERLKIFTGLKWEDLDKLCGMMTSMRNSKTRTVLQALVVFLFKLRTGNSNSTIAAVLGLDCAQQVSDYCEEVMNSFEKDVLPNRFGYSSLSREELINQTSETAKKLYELNEQLVLIFDGTYIRHEKSTNNNYQRKSYSRQKKVPLCKPFTICTTNGYIVEIEGPFYATQNDAEIMKILLNDPNGFQKIMKPGDICVVDRGFRDVVKQLEERGYKVFMPALKGKRAQLRTEESNDSRWVTKIRWVVEAIHGTLGQKYQLFHHTLDNKFLPKVRLYLRIACFLNNTFGKRLNSDFEDLNEIIQQMKSRRNMENSLAEEVETQHWNRRKTQFQQLTSTDLLDFPEMTERDLKILFTGSYQLSQAVSYLAEMMDESGKIDLYYLKASENQSNTIIKILVRSRHVNKKTYKCYIDYTCNSVRYSGLRRYTCDCPNGRRTVGCCSHIAAVIYYLSHARYLSKIIKPAEILINIFMAEEVYPIINYDSDED